VLAIRSLLDLPYQLYVSVGGWSEPWSQSKYSFVAALYGRQVRYIIFPSNGMEMSKNGTLLA
jgi:hypothetical protein